MLKDLHLRSDQIETIAIDGAFWVANVQMSAKSDIMD